MKRLITSADKVKKYSDIYSNAYKIYKESFGNISKVWDYVKSEISVGNIANDEGRMLVKDVTEEYLRDSKPKSRADKYKNLMQ
jgi:hypothetical protein